MPSGLHEYLIYIFIPPLISDSFACDSKIVAQVGEQTLERERVIFNTDFDIEGTFQLLHNQVS